MRLDKFIQELEKIQSELENLGAIKITINEESDGLRIVGADYVNYTIKSGVVSIMYGDLVMEVDE